MFLILNTICTVLVFSLVLLSLWYGVSLDIGKRADNTVLLHFHISPSRDIFHEIRNIFSKKSAWSIYDQKSSQLVKESLREQESGTYTPERTQYYRERLEAKKLYGDKETKPTQDSQAQGF